MNSVMIQVLWQVLWVMIFWAGFGVIALPEFFKISKNKAILKWIPFFGNVNY